MKTLTVNLTQLNFLIHTTEKKIKELRMSDYDNNSPQVIDTLPQLENLLTTLKSK